MSAITKFRDWTASHNPKWLALVRVALGAALLLKGVNFLDNTTELQESINNGADFFIPYSGFLSTAIPWIHIVGGFMIIIGIFTRLASLIQMPVLLGAVLFVNSKKGFFTIETDLSYSIIIVVLLLVFLIEGSGPLSLSAYFRENDGQGGTTHAENTAA
jgi:putative oxidoreductase